MQEPFKITPEKLAHELALISVANLSRKQNFQPLDYYREYNSEYRYLLELTSQDSETT